MLNNWYGLAEQVFVVSAEVNFIFHKLLGSQQSRVRHTLISFRYFYLLFVFMNFFQAVGMACKFFQFVMQLFFQSNVYLVCPFGYDGNGFIQVTCFFLYGR